MLFHSIDQHQQPGSKPLFDITSISSLSSLLRNDRDILLLQTILEGTKCLKKLALQTTTCYRIAFPSRNKHALAIEKHSSSLQTLSLTWASSSRPTLLSNIPDFLKFTKPFISLSTLQLRINAITGKASFKEWNQYDEWIPMADVLLQLPALRLLHIIIAIVSDGLRPENHLRRALAERWLKEGEKKIAKQMESMDSRPTITMDITSTRSSLAIVFA